MSEAASALSASMEMECTVEVSHNAAELAVVTPDSADAAEELCSAVVAGP